MKQFVIRASALLAFGVVSSGCSSESSAEGLSPGAPTGGGGSSGVGSADAGADSRAAGHALTMTAKLKMDGDQISFMTPSVSVITKPTSYFIGKPYMFASFPAGFSPGNDPPLDSVWGTVAPDLTIRYTTPSVYQDGAYDMVLVVYANTAITDAIKAGSAQYAPAAKGGDLATFTADMTSVRPGDPSIPAGLIRLNVEGADAEVTVDNKVTTDPSQITAALDNTVMIIP